jgi:hypothetical protein
MKIFNWRHSSYKERNSGYNRNMKEKALAVP